jgi:hypothetical protein
VDFCGFDCGFIGGVRMTSDVEEWKLMVFKMFFVKQ